MQRNDEPMSVGSWMLVIFVLAIPVVNLIMYIFWEFDGNGNINRKNFCMASLIWALILIVVGVFVSLITSLIYYNYYY